MRTSKPLLGLLNINKPAGITSRDAVNHVQRLIRPTKVGHAGTLDPIATGVLVLCVGKATRLIEHVQRMPKQYRGVFLLGRQSPSDDIELPTEEIADAPIPSREEVEAALPTFVGEILQKPPAYSAIKIRGRKAYDLARSGQPPELPARPVTIYELSIVDYVYPKLTLDVRCGSGTYIRSLGRDLAEALGTAAVMAELERTAIGSFTTAEAMNLDTLDSSTLEPAVLPATRAVADLPSITLSAEEIEELRHGRFIQRETHATDLAAIDDRGQLIALITKRGRDRLKPCRLFF